MTALVTRPHHFPRAQWAVAGVLLCWAAASWPQFDENAAWPLCGRITENPPSGWTYLDGCPSERHGNPDHTDLPLSSTFGPRLIASESLRYDWHRGIDIAAPDGTPVFAIADGFVQLAGETTGFSDPVLRIEHRRPGQRGCSEGCYYSHYAHVSGWTVQVGNPVRKGQYLGNVGSSSSGFPHLHFEIRNATPDDQRSAWQRNTIHPLRVLPYAASGDWSVGVLNVQPITANTAAVQLRAWHQAGAQRLDLSRLGVRVYALNAGTGQLEPIAQVGDTVNAEGYHLRPARLDLERNNFEYTHKHSVSKPWSSFDNCPYAQDHTPMYDAAVHLDRSVDGREDLGSVNGLEIAPERFGSSIQDYALGVTVSEIHGPFGEDFEGVCIVAFVEAVNGDETTSTWGQCDGLP